MGRRTSHGMPPTTNEDPGCLNKWLKNMETKRKQRPHSFPCHSFPGYYATNECGSDVCCHQQE